MASEFNADDILGIAVKIEKNGAEFYRQASEKVEKEENKQFLLDLAVMEDEHEATFLKMQTKLKEKEKMPATFDPYDENALYLKALADTRVFFKKEEPADNFYDILVSAVQAEKDSIVFYLGMKGIVPEKLGKSSVDDIIKEEMKHIRLLAGKLARLKN